MLRRLSTLAAAASLVLCVATCLLWARSHRALESYIVHLTDRREVSAAHVTGTLLLTTSTLTPRPGAQVGFREAAGYHRAPVDLIDLRTVIGPGFLGFGHVYQTAFGDALTFRLVAVPYWLLAALLAVAPVMWLVRASRRGRPGALGCCTACGYDLRDTPGQCPECGARVG